MSNAELVCYIIVIIGYMLVGILVSKGISNAMYSDNYLITKDDKIEHIENRRFISKCRIPISMAAGMLWIFLVVFLLWKSIGKRIYNDLIIGKDEESRIAAWFV